MLIKYIEQRMSLSEVNYVPVSKEISSDERQKITELLGLEQSSGVESKRIKRPNNLWTQAQPITELLIESEEYWEKRHLKKLIKRLQKHNSRLMQQTKEIIAKYQKHYEKMGEQIEVRDQIIFNLNQEMDESYGYWASQEQNYERKQIELKEWINQLKKQHEQKLKSMTQQHKLQICKREEENRQLKNKIMRMISDQANRNRKVKEEQRRWEIERFELNEDIKSLEDQIKGKQSLIKYLQNSNNEVRIELIDLKSKQEIEDLTWFTEKRKSLDNSELNEDTCKQNERLKQVIVRLQKELDSIISEAENMEEIILALQLQKDRMDEKILQLKGHTTNNSATLKGSIKKQNLTQTSSKQSSGHSEPLGKKNKNSLTIVIDQSSL